jgi:hypothetical protein
LEAPQICTTQLVAHDRSLQRNCCGQAPAGQQVGAVASSKQALDLSVDRTADGDVVILCAAPLHEVGHAEEFWEELFGELTIFPLILPRRYQIPTQCKMLIFHWKGLKGFGPPLTLVSSFSAAVRRSSHTVAPRPLPSPTGADKFKPPWTLWAA